MKKNKYDQPIEHSDEYYYCLLNKSRRILLYADIDSNSAYVVNFKLNAFAIEKQNEPIILEINSDGGFVNDGFAIIDTIAHLKCPVYTLVRGQVCSMASLISIVGTKRFITENSYWMQHSAAEAVADYLQHIKDRTKYLERVETQMTELMKRKTKLDKKDYEKLTHGELWLSAEECLKKGIVDEILYPKKINK